MSLNFKAFEKNTNGVSVVFESAAENSSRRDAKATVLEEIPLKDYLQGNFDSRRIGFEAQKTAAVEIIRQNLDL